MFLSFYFLNDRNMKNLMLLLIVAVVAYGAWQYNTPNQELIDAKKELWIEVDNSADNKLSEAKKEIFEQVDNAVDEAKDVVENIVEDVVEDTTPTFSTELLSGNDILELSEIKESVLETGEVDLTWKIKAHVDSIRVLYSNADSDYPDDDYPLQQFVAGSDKFLYRAHSKYQTFDYGTNIYTIIMTSWKEESKLQFTIYYPNPEKKSDNESSSDLSDETVVSKIDSDNLPTWSDYGSPIKLGENKITYSDLKWFEAEKHSVLSVSCESNLITKTIWDKTGSWSWWNTCRPSSDESYVTYYALNMKDGEYTYAKHYFSKDYYAIMELQNWIDEWWNSIETVEEKNQWLKNNNNEFKILNDTFEITKITDTLFENINNN